MLSTNGGSAVQDFDAPLTTVEVEYDMQFMKREVDLSDLSSEMYILKVKTDS